MISIPRRVQPLLTTLRSALRPTPSNHPFTTLLPPKMRVSYAPSSPPTEADQPIYTRIAARRSPRPLLPLDLALLHNTAVADGWNTFIGAIRTQTTLAANLKELAISRVAVLNHAVHEWDVHAKLAIEAGVGREGMETVYRTEVRERGEKGEDEGKGLSREEWVVLRYTDQMTIGVEVEERVMQEVKGVLGEKEVVELTAVVAAYNCVSRFLVALDVGECNGRGMKGVDEL